MKILWKIAYCLEALGELLLCKTLIVAIPFRYWSHFCGTAHCETLRVNGERFSEESIRIEYYLTWASLRLPWRCKCLERALAAQRMLTRRQIPSTIYFGLLKEDLQKWIAHSWVRCGNRWVIGYLPKKNYTVVGTFAQLQG